MGEVVAEIEIEAPVAEVWEVFLDPNRWPAWVDGFAAVTSSDGYPSEGGQLEWRSTPAGRGTVSEEVVAHQPRRLHRISYADPSATGEVETTFEMLPATDGGRKTRVAVTHVYQLVAGGILSPVVERLFVRSQMQRSLQRTLADLRIVVEGGSAGDPDPSLVTL